MSICGETTWQLFEKHLNFPSWLTIQRWRKMAHNGCYIHEATLFIQLNPSRLQKYSQDLFINALKFPDNNIHLAQMNLINYNISEFGSTRKVRITDASGYNSQKREIQLSQL